MEKKLKQLFDNSIRLYGTNPSFSLFGREEITYKDFDERTELVREMLRGAGVGSCDKVVVLGTNSRNWNVAYFAAVTSAMVAVPILPDFAAEQLNSIIRHSEAKALIVTDKLYSKISPETLAQLNIVIRLSTLGVVSRRSNELAEVREPQPDDTAVIIYTSGTTSAPKGVMLSHKALATQIATYNTPEVFPVVASDVFLSVLPLAHIYVCSVGMF